MRCYLAIIGVETINLPDANDLLESMVQGLDICMAAEQGKTKKMNLKRNREYINVELLGNLSAEHYENLQMNILYDEESLVEAKNNAANPRSEKDRQHWQKRVIDLERSIVELEKRRKSSKKL